MGDQFNLIASILAWWLAIQAIGLLALPIAVCCLRLLPGRGYLLSKPLGLLLASYIFWLGVSLNWLSNDRHGVWYSLLLLGAISCIVGLIYVPKVFGGEWLARAVAWQKTHLSYVVSGEILLFVTVAAGIVFRTYFPELIPGEKRMEMAFINAILNSQAFPPQDPWLAGYPINYYYFGYVMVTLLIRMTSELSETGYNLASGTWIGLTLTTGFAVVYDLVAASRQSDLETRLPQANRSHGMAILWGIIGSILIGVIGNLYAALLWLYQTRRLPEEWARWLDLRWMTMEPASGRWSGAAWWWYRPAGMITDRDLLGAPIELHTEFPSLSFIIGDLHPHVLGLPFLLFAIGLAAHLYLAAKQKTAVSHEKISPIRVILQCLLCEDSFGFNAPVLIMASIALGGLAFINAWDVATGLAVALSAYALGITTRYGLTTKSLWTVLVTFVLFGVFSYLCYLPFFRHFVPPLNGIHPNLFYPTRMSHFVVMFGVLLVPCMLWITLLYRGHRISVSYVVLFWLIIMIVALCLVVLAVFAIHLRSNGFITPGVQITPAVYELVSRSNLAQMIFLAVHLRLVNPWSAVGLAAFTALGLVAMKHLMRTDHRNSENLATDLFVILVMTFAFVLCLTVELIYIGDYLGSRMNTVFKFYYQAWILFAISATYGLSQIFRADKPIFIQFVAAALIAPLFAGGMFYPLGEL